MKSPRRPVGGGPTSARERIRSIEAKALVKLRHPTRSKELEDFIHDRPRAPVLPPYLNGTFLWTGLGYRYAMKLPPDLGARAAHKESKYNYNYNYKNPWKALAAILERAKAGDHAPVSALIPEIGRPGEPLALRRARIGLLADAGTDRDLDALCDWMLQGPDDLRVDACWAAALAGSGWLVPSMLTAYHRAGDPRSREAIGFWISDLLEEDGGPVGRAVRGPTARFDRLARAQYERIAGQLGDDRIPIWCGRASSVIDLARRMHALVTNHAREVGLTGVCIPLRHKLEAATGIDASAFFDGGEINPLAAAAALGAFLESPRAERYARGVRYFFEHPVPTGPN